MGELSSSKLFSLYRNKEKPKISEILSSKWVDLLFAVQLLIGYLYLHLPATFVFIAKSYRIGSPVLVAENFDCSLVHAYQFKGAQHFRNNPAWITSLDKKFEPQIFFDNISKGFFRVEWSIWCKDTRCFKP